MKKILKLLIISISVLLLFSCGKTEITIEKGDFKDLSTEKQQEISEYSIEILTPQLKKIMGFASDFSLSDEESNKKMNEIREESKKLFNETVQKKYPEVNFWEYITFENYIDQKILIPNLKFNEYLESISK